MKSVIASNKVESGWVLVSTVDSFDHGLETMVFECDQGGSVINWSDLDCNRYDDWSEAESGHERMVAEWRGGVLH